MGGGANLVRGWPRLCCTDHVGPASFMRRGSERWWTECPPSRHSRPINFYLTLVSGLCQTRPASARRLASDKRSTRAMGRGLLLKTNLAHRRAGPAIVPTGQITKRESDSAVGRGPGLLAQHPATLSCNPAGGLGARTKEGCQRTRRRGLGRSEPIACGRAVVVQCHEGKLSTYGGRPSCFSARECRSSNLLPSASGRQ